MKSAKIKKKCNNCGEDLFLFPSVILASASKTHFCNKSCHRSYKNKINNPSKFRDLSGKNNPMYGKHRIAWNKGQKGSSCFNWRGGIHARKDGYIRINIDGKRHLLHRYLLKKALKTGNVIHHKDKNPSNNSLENLVIMNSQAEHAHLHATT